MNLQLPTASEEDVKRFKNLMNKQFDTDLTDQEALDGLTRLVQYIFLTEHILPALKKDKK